MSIFRIRAAKNINETDGKVLGTVEAKDAYEAAVTGSRKHFKPTGLPHRETCWPGKSGAFSVPEATGETFFYVETT